MKKNDDNTIPTPTATRRSINTVKTITSKRTMESLFFKLNSLFIPLKSIIPIPTEINSAERTGLGTIARYCPRPSKTIKRKIPLKIPLKLVVPLEFMLATVPVVDPAPGIPPNKEVSKFPNP